MNRYKFKKVTVEDNKIEIETFKLFAASSNHAQLRAGYMGKADFDFIGKEEIVDTLYKGVEWDSMLIPHDVQKK